MPMVEQVSMAKNVYNYTSGLGIMAKNTNGSTSGRQIQKISKSIRQVAHLQQRTRWLVYHTRWQRTVLCDKPEVVCTYWSSIKTTNQDLQ